MTILAVACASSPEQKLAKLKSNLAFTCKHEPKPTLSADTQKLYDYARYHDLHNLWKGKRGDAVWQNAAVYYRIAAANGDYKANIRLQSLLYTVRVSSENARKEVIQLNEALEKQLPATAYYNYYIYLKSGFGVRAGLGDELAYLRKAADLGNKNAQYELAENLERIQDRDTRALRLKIAEELLSCSSAQGMGKASKSLGIGLQIDKRYQEALRVFHQGVKNGDSGAALRLQEAFDKGRKSDDMYFLSLKSDSERVIRYKMIENYLYKNDYLNPTVPDLDKIVPLPPAKLPAWDGKIAFQRWYEGPSPAKPSDALMQKLADNAGLDVKTGLPLKK
ncbi:sel1 repeat family protein [Aggregatibacter actinomycetemcomitans]|nr:sel1 repeat family protein [Aggregatibacter actinomycetemcomitans]